MIAFPTSCYRKEAKIINKMRIVYHKKLIYLCVLDFSLNKKKKKH